MITTIRDEVRALRDDRAEQHDPARLLAGTPLGIEADRHPARTPLSLAEQINVVAVMVVSQAIQVVFFTAGLFAFFLALGHHRHSRRRDRAVGGRGDLPGRRTTVRGNMVRSPHPDTADGGAHVAVRRGAVRAVLHGEHERRPAVPAALLRPAGVRRGGEPCRPRRLPRRREDLADPASATGYRY